MPTKERLTLEQLQATPVFGDLTQRQQKLVETFIATNGDRIASVLAAYSVKTPSSARILAYEYFSSPRVIAAIAAYFQTSPLESFKAEVRKAYRNSKLSVAQIEALKLHAVLNGWHITAFKDLYDVTPKLTKKVAAAQKAALETPASRIPPGCKPVRDAAGELKGYMDLENRFVGLATVEVVR
jgi:hypothetical protein